MNLAVGVVARGNEVAAARVLVASLAGVHPEWPVTVLAMPGLRPALHRDSEPFRVLTPSDVGGAAVNPLLAAAPQEPVAALMRPLLLRRLLDDGADAVLLLPPDAEIFSPLIELTDLLASHSAVLVPRLLGSLPDDALRPGGRELLEAGEVDHDLAAVSAGEAGDALLDWWTERGHEAAETAAAIRTAPGVETPAARLGASPLAAARMVFGDLGWLDHPGYDVSYWNLHERPLGRDGETITAGGAPLRLMRFYGFHPERPWWLSEHASRTLVLDDPVLSELLARRSRRLLEAGWVRQRDITGAGDELSSGLRFDEMLRRLHAEALDSGEDFGDVMSPGGGEAFESWLREPAPHGGLKGINRYCHHIWRARPDVQEAYPDLDGADADGFIGWLWVHGRPELRLQPALLPPPPEWVERIERRIPNVLVTGYLRGHLGLGQAARGYVAALQAAGVPVATRSVPTDPPIDRTGAGASRRPDEREFEELALDEGVHPDVQLLCVNPDQLPGFAADFGEDELRSRYTIGQWAWETDAIPERWEEAFELVDEVWVYSSYIAESLARATDVPVVVMPLPVEPPDPGGAHLPFEVPDGFVFLFAFDFFSTLKRKNPVGLVEAFKQAFAPGEGPTLLLKTMNAGFRPEAREQLRYAIGDRPDIRMVDVTLSPPEMAALLARGDCFVSLHRSEGYGLGLAEAMALGKPVIGTAYSGNTDFMTPANSYLVDWRPAAVGPDAEHYPPEGTWAEPSLEHAAALMREVWLDRESAARRGERARADITVRLSARAVGDIARARLALIGARRRGDTREAHAPYPLDEVPRRLAFDLNGGEGGGRVLVRRAIMRLLRPYSTRERRLDEAVAASLYRLYGDLEAERAARERDRRRIARLEKRIADLSARRD